jgi:hypothetical protein
MLNFGSGTLFGTALTDAFGNALATPTPILLGVLQDCSIDLSFDVKELYGQNQFPVAVGRGKGKVAGKAKFAQLNGLTINTLFFGQTLAAGTLSDVYDTTGVAAAATITPTVPSSGTWTRDLGVMTGGIPMKRVASAPAIGQYSVTAGVYTFNASQTGTLFISYQYTATSTIAQKSTVQNVPMGYAPTFSADFYNAYQGKALTVTLNSCISTKLTLATKLDDFLISEFDFSAFADANGNVMSYGLSE